MVIATVSPSRPMSSSLPLSSPRCVSFHSSTPSISFHRISSVATCRFTYQWRQKLQETWNTRSPPLWRVSSTDSAATEIFPASDNGSGSAIVSALLLTAFIGLSLLTIGVIYLAVQDFLQKRERDRFEKEESDKKKKGGKKKRVRVRDGPRGFGQKVEDEDDV